MKETCLTHLDEPGTIMGKGKPLAEAMITTIKRKYSAEEKNRMVLEGLRGG